MDFQRTMEMSLSREEFLRFLPAAVGSFVVNGDEVRRSDGNRGWVIRLVPLADHRVGSVVVSPSPASRSFSRVTQSGRRRLHEPLPSRLHARRRLAAVYCL